MPPIGINSQLFVLKYQLYLPDREALKAEIVRFRLKTLQRATLEVTLLPVTTTGGQVATVKGARAHGAEGEVSGEFGDFVSTAVSQNCERPAAGGLTAGGVTAV